ncbi:tRNA (pseudouridine(54)-N(1))-methyltransferase TrmY [Geoglobus acetivorans]|uniref:tRNA (pseudouridine(54)-N(1))-methyltransferase n=1 Tax=Geoglobus acetivorans TaxID=565033 RepID=A0A0A7GEC1_GEOAI|nr:protein of unknown function DUF358 [Geoglobus acetivorans]
MDRVFVLIANRAVTAPFNLNDLPGSAGRMDIVCRFISQSLFVSHGIRKNVTAYIILKGPPDPVKSIRVEGSQVRYLAPDERNIAGMINKALKTDVGEGWTRVSPGIFISSKGLDDVLKELSGRNIYYLKETGKDIENVEVSRPVFVIGDHLGVSEEDEKSILEISEEVISLEETAYQADQCVTILNYILDRREHDRGM